VRIVLADIAAHLAKELLRISVTTPAAAIATPYGTVGRADAAMDRALSVADGVPVRCEGSHGHSHRRSVSHASMASARAPPQTLMRRRKLNKSW
jgi:hypothetical protein